MSRLLRFHAATLLGRRLRAARTPMLRAIADAGGSQVRVFGSVATEQEGPHSDIDLVFTMGTPWSLMELERCSAGSATSSAPTSTSCPTPPCVPTFVTGCAEAMPL